MRPRNALSLAAVGAGLKPQHYAEILAESPEIGFFEIHAENYMSAGGPAHRWLRAIAEHYPLSVHGVGLSLGSTEKLDHGRLARLARLVKTYRPSLVSEHLAWSDFSGRAFPDLLPLPYDEAALRRTAEKIDATQNALGRQILIENPATYLRFAGAFIAETQFLRQLADLSGCGLLLDVNNVFVCATNHGFDAQKYLDAFPLEQVGEIHLAGCAEAQDAQGAFLIDDHGGAVRNEVWALYEKVLRAAGPRPTLIEWDNHLPDWPELHRECGKAREIVAAALIIGAVANPPAPHPNPLPVETGRGGENVAEPWQALFAAALDNPGLPAPPLFAPCDAEARFAVYRNNSAVAAINALEEQFPTVLKLVGDEAFSGLARIFARENPPVSPVLGEYGAGFPEFLEKFLAAAGDAEAPYLPDCARLDALALAALRAPEAAPAPLARLAELDMGRLATLRALPHPSLALLASSWPLLDLREGAVEDWRGGDVLVLRPEAELLLLPCPPGAAAFLRACGHGESLPAAAAAGAEAEENFDFGATLVELTRLGAFTQFA